MAYLGKVAGTNSSGTSKDSFSGDGSTTAFTMSSSVHLVTDVEVFVDNVQHISQTVSKCWLSGGGDLNLNNLSGAPQGQYPKQLTLYPKSVTQNPTKTSIIITGESSGAVIEYDVSITYDTVN